MSTDNSSLPHIATGAGNASSSAAAAVVSELSTPVSVTSLIREKLLSHIGSTPSGRTHSKITIVGSGAVGLATAYSILNQGLTSELALVDVAEDRLKGEAMDLVHGSAFMKRCTIKASSDYAVSEGSDLVFITAGARQREGETRLNLVARNVEIFKTIVLPIVKYSPKCTICVIANPVDIMTAVTAKLSGFPAGRVFGSGTALDSSRFRTLVAQRLGVDARSVHGAILGEHGDSSVPAWSLLNVAGVRLRDLHPTLGTVDDPEQWGNVHKEVVASAYEIIKAKGFTNWAIGLTCASIAECVLRNEARVFPLSVPASGRYGIPEASAESGNFSVYLSLPAILGIDGVRDVLQPLLDTTEIEKLRASASAIGKVQAGLTW